MVDRNWNPDATGSSGWRLPPPGDPQGPEGSDQSSKSSSSPSRTRDALKRWVRDKSSGRNKSRRGDRRGLNELGSLAGSASAHEMYGSHDTLDGGAADHPLSRFSQTSHGPWVLGVCAVVVSCEGAFVPADFGNRSSSERKQS